MRPSAIRSRGMPRSRPFSEAESRNMTPDRSEALVGWDASTDPPRLSLRGDWTLANYAALGREIERLPTSARDAAALDAQFGALDTAGAARLIQLLGPDAAARLAQDEGALSPERRALLGSVANAARQTVDATAPKQPPFWNEFLERIGSAMQRFYVHTRD